MNVRDDEEYDDEDIGYPEEENDVEVPASTGTYAFQWSGEQAAALNAIEQWRRGRGGQIFRLFGFAGTGKTTVVKEIARRMGGNVLYCAYTGKAALVMQRMGCTGAKTIHSVIYKPLSELVEEAKAIKAWLADYRANFRGSASAEDCKLYLDAERRWGTADPKELEARLYQLRARIEAGPSWVLREKLDPEPRVIICDEVSMVNEGLGRDLMEFGVPIIAIGDPFQLPPPKSVGGYFTEAEPDAMLTQIHRQALDSPIIRMATTVRKDGAWALKLGEYGDSRYLAQSIEESLPMLIEADQVLAGKHKTRRAINAAMREHYGYIQRAMDVDGGGDAYMPQPGEKIICKRNDKLNRLLNGGMWIVQKCQPRGEDAFMANIVSMDDGSERDEIVMHAEPFRGLEILPEDKFDAQEFDHGYCITVHSSQGSQWPHVALVNDGWSGPDRFLDRWLYTAVTRAQEKVTIIKPQAQARSSRPEKPRVVSDFRTAKPRGLSKRKA